MLCWRYQDRHQAATGPAVSRVIGTTRRRCSLNFPHLQGDDLPLFDTLAMFYDYRDRPIGRRDEMIAISPITPCQRRSADVQATCQSGRSSPEEAARAQVTARLAMVYLMKLQGGPGDRRTSHDAVADPRRTAAARLLRGTCAERHRPPRSRPRHHLQSHWAQRSVCGRISTGARGAGVRHPNRSNSITASAGAISGRSTRMRKAMSSVQ